MIIDGDRERSMTLKLGVKKPRSSVLCGQDERGRFAHPVNTITKPCELISYYTIVLT
jgi:hypothetical protein